MNFKEIIDFIKSNTINAKQRISEDGLKYLIYSGRLREVVKQRLMEEFKDEKTIKTLENRITPINIIRKSIDKLAKCYKNAPTRTPSDLNPGDHELIKLYSTPFEINKQMQYANKLFKLHKHTLIEPYLDKNKIPRIRAIPSHMFWLFSDDEINPEKPTKIVKLLNDAEEDKYKRYAVWTNEEHFVVDGKGTVDAPAMSEMNNEEGVNPYGVMPFVHINESLDLLYPVRPTDMISVQIAICLLLSDCCLAQKYLSFATLTVIGGSGEEKLHVGPGAIIQIPMGVDGSKPEIKYLQPNLNATEVMELVDKLVEYLLYTNNLSAGQSIGKMNMSNISSGVAKMVDEAQSTEDKEEQRTYFEEAEKELWGKFAHNILPVWVAEAGRIHPDYTGAFTPDFELNIEFQDMKPMLTEKEQIEIIIMKLKNGLMTTRSALEELYPGASEEAINEMMSDIDDEKETIIQKLGGTFEPSSET